MKWIDTHAHLYFDEVFNNVDTVVDQALGVGVSRIIMPSVDAQSCDQMKAVMSKFPLCCFSMIGLHPCYVKEDYKQELASLQERLYASPQSYIAVGEIGLDFYHDLTFVEQQKEAFIEQIHWAKEKNLPISIHSRQAEELAFEMVKKEKVELAVFHCFSGDLHLAKKMINAGYYIGVGGTFTYKKNEELRETIKSIGLSHVVLETDTPYLAPVPFRGKMNIPSYIPFVGKSMATHLDVSEEEVSSITTANAERLFGL